MGQSQEKTQVIEHCQELVRNISRACDEEEILGKTSALPEIMEQGYMPFLGQDGPQNGPRKNRGTDWGKLAPRQRSKPCVAQFLPGNRSQGQTLLRNATGVKKAFDSLFFCLQRCTLRCPDLPTEIPLLLKAQP